MKDATENITPNGGSATQSWKQTFTFDRYGNRRFDFANGNTTMPESNCPEAICNPTISTTNNRINSTGYTFDNAGNTTRDASDRKFTYDAENKQVKVESLSPGTNTVTGTIGEYFYDGDGKRVKKYVPSTGEVTVFVYDAAGKQIAEYSTIVETTNAKVGYLTNDHLGSPRINTDANGAATSRHDYHPFGEEIATSQRTAGLGYVDDTVRKQFTGYERDNESGLDYAQARMYGNSHGRFTSPDPTLLSVNGFNPQSWNRYVYVLNNPLLYTDPLGLWAVRFDPVYKKDKDSNATTEIDYYIAVAVKTKDNDDAASLAKQLGLRGKEAEKFAKNFGEKLADGKITGDNVQLSKLGGVVGRVYGVVEDLYTDQKKYEAKHGNDGKGPGNGTYADCSTTACNLADPMAGANGQNWSVHVMDEYIRNNGLKSVAEGDLRISDIVRYATGEGNRNVPAHFTTFIFMNDNGDPLVFSRSGEGGPFQVNTAKSFENATYGRIRGIGKDATGYYRPR